MNSYGRLSEFAWLHAFLILATDGGDWTALRTGCFYAWGKNRRFPFNRRLGGTRSQSESFGEKRYLLPCWKLSHRSLYRLLYLCSYDDDDDDDNNNNNNNHNPPMYRFNTLIESHRRKIGYSNVNC
jgi:hypothetical protein